MEEKINNAIKYLNKEKEFCKEILLNSNEDIEINFIQGKINGLNEGIQRLEVIINFK